MFGKDYYNKTIEKVISAFGTVFNDIKILRKNNSSADIQKIPVPIRWVQKRDWYYKTSEDAELDRYISTVCPKMGFEITSFTLDTTRQLPKTVKDYNVTGAEFRNEVFRGVPYTLGFTLYIETTTLSDMFQILENILPMFSPTYTVSSNSMPSLDIKEDLHIRLNNVNNKIEYLGKISEGKTVEFQLDFTIPVIFRGPVSERGTIKQVVTNIYVRTESTQSVPTTPPTVKITVDPDPLNADFTQPYDYTVTIDENE